MIGAAVNFRNLATLLALPLNLLACGVSKVALDDSLIESSGDPSVLAVVRERVEKIVVDDQRMYWIGSQLPRIDDDDYVWYLRSCQKRNCASTLVTYGVQSNRWPYLFAVNAGQVYWHDGGRLLACPIAGCNGSPRTLADGLSVEVATFANERFYFSGSSSLLSFYDLSISKPDPQEVFASLPPPAGLAELAIHEHDAYALAKEFVSLGFETSAGLLVRIRQDGTSPIEAIASDVKYSRQRERGFGLATDATSIYWTDNLLTGAIKRCPLTGCSGESAVVLSPLRAPQTLQIDESELYYVYESEPYRYALSSCTLPACTPSSPLIEHLDAPEALAMDDEYLYVATTEQDVSPSNYTENTIATIRRLPSGIEDCHDPTRREPGRTLPPLPDRVWATHLGPGSRCARCVRTNGHSGSGRIRSEAHRCLGR